MTEIRSLGFAQEIAKALQVRSPHDSIAAIKNAVIKELETLDRTVTIRDTSYFNHTYAPDLILNWNTLTERPVYLRFTDNLLELQEGISKLDFENPIVFGLTPLPDDAEGYLQLEQSAQRNHSLITDADGIETLINWQRRNAGVHLLSQATTRGGRGLLARPQAESLATTVSRGFTAALKTQTAPTRLALDAVAQYLDNYQAASMTRVLQAIWEGSDDRLKQFPGSTDLSESLNDDSLQYVLDVVSTSDLNFWRRIGRGLTTSLLSRMTLSPSNDDSFQNLINANLDVIPCRAATVFPSSETRFPTDSERFRWSIHGNALSLEGPDFTAFVADRKEQVQGKVAVSDVTSGNGVDVETLRKRVAAHELTGVTLRVDGATLQFTLAQGVGHNERLIEIVQGLSANSTVVKAVVSLTEGQLALNFKSSLAIAKATSMPLLKDVLAISIPLLCGLPVDRRELVEAFLHTGKSVMSAKPSPFRSPIPEQIHLYNHGGLKAKGPVSRASGSRTTTGNISDLEPTPMGMLVAQRPTLSEEVVSENRSRFVIEPLEPGFGYTLGNSLRRTLLSSIPGAAVTSIRLDGVLPEFTTVPGVKEDVTEIIRNLKGLSVSSEHDEPVVAYLRKQGPGVVTAADIAPPAGVEFHNPDMHIATLNSKGKFELELTIERGRGYVSAGQNKNADQEIGRIPVDSIYSPVLKVTFRVEATRVEQRTDFDKLIVDVETKQAISPRDAITSSGTTLVELFGLARELNTAAEDIESGPSPTDAGLAARDAAIDSYHDDEL